ncbi:unnamed protein product [Calypogeia fissa]
MKSPVVQHVFQRRPKRSRRGYDVEETHVQSSPLNESKRSVLNTNEGHQNQGDHSKGSAAETMEATNCFVHDSGSEPSSETLEGRRGLQRQVARGHLLKNYDQTMNSKRNNYTIKVSEFRKTLTQFLDLQDEAHDDEIQRVTLECNELHKFEKLALQREIEVLQRHKEELNLRCKLVAQVTELEAAVNQLKQYVEEPVHQATKSVVPGRKRSGKRRLIKRVQQSSGDSPALGENLRPNQRNEDDKLHAAAICGSYTDGVAKPTRLHLDMSIARAAVTAFHLELFECFKRNHLLDKVDDVFFARPNHRSHYFKSAVNRVFFDGFEDESFNTICGVSRFLDPNHRQETFFQYYLHEREQRAAEFDIEDPQFAEFCAMKVYAFMWKMVRPASGNTSEVSLLESLGGPNLVSTFKSAAKTVWLLHKLAFSFEPPASIFEVKEGADMDPKYMVSTIVQLDDDERLVPKVGFVIDPGLLLREEIVMPCEVYLAGRPRIPQ